MRRVRVIPVLLLHKGGLYKSIKFKDYQYVGDPINAVKVFNEKEVDEIVILDIDATARGEQPDIDRISDMAGEAFMPMAYGGGVTTIDQVKRILYEGVEKIVFNNSAISNPALINKTAKLFGSSSVVVSIDAKKDWLGNYKVYGRNGKRKIDIHPAEMAKNMENEGAGEIFINSIDMDGTFKGFDLNLIASVSHAISIPTIACGGAGSLAHFREAIKTGASAVAAGSYFVFQRPHKAVLVTYPPQELLKKELFLQI